MAAPIARGNERMHAPQANLPLTPSRPNRQENRKPEGPHHVARNDSIESALARLLGEKQAVLAMQFARFGSVGAIGFIADTAVVYATKAAIGLYWAGVLAFIAAATVTWLGNRLYTFRGRAAQPLHRQWALFVATNTGGFVLNRGTYFILVATFPLCAANPVLAILGGVLVGMTLNFYLSRRFVFR
jgi:putative flippase GtrA